MGPDTGQDPLPATAGAAATAAAGHPPGVAAAGVTAVAGQPAEAGPPGEVLHALSAGHLQGPPLHAAVVLPLKAVSVFVLELTRLYIWGIRDNS